MNGLSDWLSNIWEHALWSPVLQVFTAIQLVIVTTKLCRWMAHRIATPVRNVASVFRAASVRYSLTLNTLISSLLAVSAVVVVSLLSPTQSVVVSTPYATEQITSSALRPLMALFAVAGVCFAAWLRHRSDRNEPMDERLARAIRHRVVSREGD